MVGEELHSHLPRDLRDTDVISVEALPGFRVRVTHRDGTSAVHLFDPEEFTGVAEPLRNSEVFTTAQIVDGDTLGWVLPDGLVYDVGPDALWLHAHGYCDGSHDLAEVVER
ncbi:DUF2442 domain-containing protein [Mycobacteroides abscessus]|uniref:DUF2442 domain-containing protein n=1 Tax=Mycobacteroides abscessus TaxID=36809 RepID=UPI00092613E1|nr:DUF2442 domain-containing protein [Mycobacteroides abscessus]MBN7371079.1 DUF2442 domain-containing protein [Mycobacteroides abscessus subsp. abscessus]MBN7522537.1 DUF2442 domain-containing protein [Mycobacteroides abscessus subsp. abscessus]MDB2185185.1 DUF2442 domain-containing protein [Mycobacteroides abscessus subsp. abscessus]MDO3123462.1 DUF2442 domain-containing protein [Mycobacteroides abscessus subsp. abscessus]MDO3173273.1 DUF2442 domain-containing protein [Mycobacteroides absces